MIEMSRAAVERREKRNAESRAWREANRDDARAAVRKSNLRKKFGLTVEQYDAMLIEQGGACAICRKPPGKRRLAVDHDHNNGHVRGLLCGNCNTGLGKFNDNAPLLLAAGQYLERNSIQ